MNKFDKIINKKTDSLLEFTENPIIKQSLTDIQQALKASGKVNSNANTKTLADQLFNIADEESPLKSAFNKINKNPEMPNLSAEELEAFLSVAQKLNPPEKKETEETENKSTQSTTQSTQQKTSQQPNAVQYNPLAQS